MPTEALTHEENLRRVCFLCLKKIERGQERSVLAEVKKKDGSVTTFRHLIIKYVDYKDYELDFLVLPGSLCPTCVRILNSQTSEVKKKIPGPHQWSKMAADMRQLSLEAYKSTSCTCNNCFIAREKGWTKTPSIYLKKEEPRPRKNSDPIPVCPNCQREVLRIHTHKCVKNDQRFKSIIDRTSPEGLKKLQVYIEKEIGPFRPKVQIGATTLQKIMVGLNLSYRKTVKMAQILAGETKGLSTEEYFRQKLTFNLHILDDHFELKALELFEKVCLLDYFPIIQ